MSKRRVWLEKLRDYEMETSNVEYRITAAEEAQKQRPSTELQTKLEALKLQLQKRKSTLEQMHERFKESYK